MKRPAGICINCAHVCPPLRLEDPLIKEILLHSATGGQKLYTVPLTVLTGPQFLIFLTSISFCFCLFVFANPIYSILWWCSDVDNCRGMNKYYPTYTAVTG